MPVSLAILGPRHAYGTGDLTEQRSNRLPQFFLTPGGPCPYLPGRVERKVFARLSGPLAQPLNEALTHSGFRRSQMIAYRPACDGCNACVSVRIAVNGFAVTRSQKRILKRNGDLLRQEVPAAGHARTIRTAAHLSRLRAMPAAACRTWACSTMSPWSRKRRSTPISSNTAARSEDGTPGR